jgi:hypothetical protein
LQSMFVVTAIGALALGVAGTVWATRKA